MIYVEVRHTSIPNDGRLYYDWAVKCPPIGPTAVFCDDPYQAARMSARLAKRGQYLALLDGPRVTRSDAPVEAVRKTNSLAFANPKSVIACGLSTEAIGLISPRIPPKMLRVIDSPAVMPARPITGVTAPKGSLVWGMEAIGVGVLKAMYAGVDIEFSEGANVERVHGTRSDHLVVIEAGELHSEVIAANYAFSIGAGLAIIPAIPDEAAEEIIEDFYSAQDSRTESASQILQRLRATLRNYCSSVELPEGGSVTFISKSLPLGFGFPEIPSTHLFTYPDLGRTILNGFTAEQPDSRGVNIAAVVDPGTTPAPEIAEAAISLADRGILVRGYRGPNASVRNITEMVESFPYDFLIIATHCGDVAGHQWTYDFKDSEGIQRNLVVDIAVGFGGSDDPEIVRVSQHIRFHSLDGIDWTDRAAKSKHYVGSALRDFFDQKLDNLEPTKKVRIDRVVGSAALQMSDSLYLPFLNSIANNESPIILNNACTSWRELSSRFIYGGARAYIGTLVPVSGIEAQELTRGLLGRSFGKPLAHALWSSQRKIYGSDGRAPYVVTGVYPQRLRTKRQDNRRLLFAKLRKGLTAWTERSQNQADASDATRKDTAERLSYYRRELGFMKQMERARARDQQGGQEPT